jgi:altronate dehydratase small subunit
MLSMKPRAFQIHPADNVATLLDDAEDVVQVLGAQLLEIRLLEKISRGHKVALQDIARGGALVKFGAEIGHAIKPIKHGAWVHLHNLASNLDERSATLDLHSGVPTDTSSAYV